MYNKDNNKPQRAFIEDKENRELLFLGGRGSGKTFGGCIKGLDWMVNRGITTGGIIAPTYKQLQVVQETLWEIMWDIPFSREEKVVLNNLRQKNRPYLVANYNKKNFDLELVNGSRVNFRSGDDPDALRGYNWNWAYIDEAALMNPQVLENVRLCLRQPSGLDKNFNGQTNGNENFNGAPTHPRYARKPVGKLEYSANQPSEGLVYRYPGVTKILWVNQQLFMTSTPRGYNYLYEVAKNIKVYHATTLDNQGNLSPEFIESLPKSGSWYRQEVLGEFISLEGLIYPSYRVGVPEIAEVLRVSAGIDIGWSSPTSVVYAAEVRTTTGALVTWIFNDSIYQTELTSTDLSYLLHGLEDTLRSGNLEEVMGGTGGNLDYRGLEAEPALPVYRERGLQNFRFRDFLGYYVDPSAQDYITDLVRSGLVTTGANHRVMFGINVVSSANLVIAPWCSNVLQEIKLYSWQEGKEEAPVKLNDHAMDAMRYALVALHGGGEAMFVRLELYDTDRYLWDRIKCQ